jgi:hypothetical protein
MPDAATEREARAEARLPTISLLPLSAAAAAHNSTAAAERFTTVQYNTFIKQCNTTVTCYKSGSSNINIVYGRATTAMVVRSAAAATQ